MFTMFTVLSSSSFAGSYTAELAIPATYPATASGGLVGFARDLVAVDEPDMSVASTDPRVRCAVEDGVVVAKFQADAENWPTTLPLDVVCAHGGESLTVRLVAMNAAVSPGNQPTALINGDTIVLTKIAGAAYLTGYTLPGNGYSAGTYPSPNMTATKCIVSGDNLAGWWIQLRSGSNAGSGSGTCVIPRPGQSPFVVNVQVTEAPI